MADKETPGPETPGPDAAAGFENMAPFTAFFDMQGEAMRNLFSNAMKGTSAGEDGANPLGAGSACWPRERSSLGGAWQMRPPPR
jgi:hypothetical protein